ncbi:MAG TPA: protein DpdJ [Burkholderiales bacterium]|nr:protein DpdJ [Burkholderiales bacterium]
MDKALGAIEQREAVSLSWGYVDGSLSEDELDEVLRNAVAEEPSDVDTARLIDDLLDRKLIRSWRQEGQRRYRTRFAELLRLLVKSRQWFPNKAWQSAPPLVADFRFDIRARRYPRREISPSDAWIELTKTSPSLSKTQQKVWEAMLPPGVNLARFQLEATRRLLNRGQELGTIVTAGTGSGKTFAFYLPTLLSLAEDSSAHFVKAIAIYPRQELLKDQLTEALRLAIKSGPALQAAGKRSLSLGTYFGATPRTLQEDELLEQGWSRRGGGAFLCPLVRCPICGSDMIWPGAANTSGQEILVCVRPSCGTKTSPDLLRLTRQSVSRSPPDALFTTTEMLNQRLSDVRVRHLFGIGKSFPERPRFLLLDEVHTYQGLSGAQTGLLLRRWRHLLDYPIAWVGLSATLREAEQFFANLTGLRPDQVLEVTPRESDMLAEGAEYQIALRSNPASQTSTLSTSIQSIMLLGRLLDKSGTSTSNGRFGSRLFTFTDDLDATNRLFDNLRDAEAYDRFGRPDTQRLPLAALRQSGTADDAVRELEGQRWLLAEELRGSLDNRLAVSRTTSRDQGVDMATDVVVATSALEVGFNDPDVGAVLQHKAPRGVASFLQRRGRAGRQRGMRPITLTVLSDYGRDRLAFQNYERLFDPTVPRQVLPVRNTHVLRMQAVYALLDWLAQKAGARGANGWSWDALSAPARSGSSPFLDVVKQLLQALLRLEAEITCELSEHIKRSLQIDDATVNLLFWEPPRALLTEAIPTLARRLFRNWKLATEEGQDVLVPFHPLPDFIPRALFGELTLPEIQIDLPPSRQGGERSQEPMPALQALQQFAPGRVRRRFADDYGGLAHWFPLDHNQPVNIVPIDSYAPQTEYVDSYSGSLAGASRDIKVFRPWVIAATRAHENVVLPTSNGEWHWQTDLATRGTELRIETANNSEWRAVVPELDFYLHRFGAAVSVARFAVEGSAEIRLKGGTSRHVRFRLQDDRDEPVAIGFAYESDGLTIPLRLPDTDIVDLSRLSDETRRWVKTMRLREAFVSDSELPDEVNAFQREWLFLATLLAAIVIAETKTIDLRTAAQQALAEDNARAVRDALQNLVKDVDDDHHDESRLQKSLGEHLDNDPVVRRLSAIVAGVLDATPDNWSQWLSACLHETLCEATLQACLLAAPENTALEGLSVECLSDGDTRKVVLTESTMGGGGTLEVLAQTFALDPRSFFRSLEAVLTPTDLELAAEQLEQIVGLSQANTELSDQLALIRAAQTHEARNKARRLLVAKLGELGIAVDHTLSVSLATRLLRPGASAESDRILFELLKHREAISTKHDLGLPYRITPHLLPALSSSLAQQLALLGGADQAEANAELLLWPEAGEIRTKSLQTYNPFRRSGVSDAAVVRDLLMSQSRRETVQLADQDWRTKAQEVLVKRGSVRLEASSKDESTLRSSVISLMSSPISTGYFQFFVTLEGMTRNSGSRMSAELVLREQV